MQLAETDPIRSDTERLPGPRPKPVDDPRVYLAAERTFLAWIRTSVALMGFGFLIARFAFLLRDYTEVPGGTTSATRPPGPHPISPWLGFGMVVVGVLVSVMAASRHHDYIRDLRAGIANPPLKMGWSLTIASILALVGLSMSIQIWLFSS